MRKRHHRKARKTGSPVSRNTPCVDKESRASIILDIDQIPPYFKIKISEPIATYHGATKTNSQENGNQLKRRRNTKKNTQLEQSTCSKDFMALPWDKIQSIAFFIPLSDCICGYDELLFQSQTHTPLMIPRYLFFIEPHVNGYRSGDGFRKSRSLSESSINSDDSFICFELSDSLAKEELIADTVDVAPRNNCTSIHFNGDVPSRSISETKKRKRVRFADTEDLVTVHLIIAWDFAYRAARISPWETVARDSNRFRLKVQSLEPMLSPVLTSEHRSKVWDTRMKKYYSSEG